MMTINQKKAEEDYKKFIEQFKDDLEDYTKDKLEQLNVDKEKQQEVLNIIKGE